MLTFVIDCRGVASEAEFWARYVEAVQPEGAERFGRSLDAFWQAVEWGGPGWPGKCVLHFANTHELRGLDDGAFLERLRAAARNATSLEISLG